MNSSPDNFELVFLLWAAGLGVTFYFLVSFFRMYSDVKRIREILEKQKSEK